MLDNNEYWMKFCNETSSLNCKEKKCEYKIYCSRHKWLIVNETKNNIKKQEVKNEKCNDNSHHA